MKEKPIVAIVSPNGDSAYSETFIKAHKENLAGTIKYYQWGFMPSHLEGYGFLRDSSPPSLLKKILDGVSYRLGISTFEEPDRKALKQSFLREGVQLVLAEYGPTGAEIVDVCRELQLPLIVHFHGQDASDKEFMEPYRKGYDKCFEYASSIVAVSNDMVNSLLELGCPENKIQLNTYGPNELFASVKPSYSSKQIICIGRFVDKKAPYYSVLAFREVLRKAPDAKLSFIGDGPLLETCMNIVTHLELQNSIEFLGVLNPAEIVNQMNSSAIFTQHSICDRKGNKEGTPLAVLEATSAGLPVVSTKHAGISDVVVEGETGYLVDEHDVKGQADRLLELVVNPEKCAALGESGRKRVQDHFSMERHIAALDQLINECLTSSNG